MFRSRALSRLAAEPSLLLTQLIRKTRVYWSPTLPEYSPTHKLAAGVYFSAFFVFSLVGLVSSRQNTPLMTISVLGIVVLSLASELTVVDYDLRYRLPVELLMIPLCAGGLTSVGLSVWLSKVTERSAAW